MTANVKMQRKSTVRSGARRARISSKIVQACVVNAYPGGYVSVYFFFAKNNARGRNAEILSICARGNLVKTITSLVKS